MLFIYGNSMNEMKGAIHSCDSIKVNKLKFRKVLRDSILSSEECSLVWDFYVSRSFASETANKIDIEDYGWKYKCKKYGYDTLEKVLLENAGIEKFFIIRAKTIKNTIKMMNLSDDNICISHARAVLTQKYKCNPDENEQVKIESDESRINAIFRHIRNSFAHGNTFFFDNGMCLLEDKDGRSITAEILIPQKSLFEWIYIVDRGGKYYTKC